MQRIQSEQQCEKQVSSSSTQVQRLADGMLSVLNRSVQIIGLQVDQFKQHISQQKHATPGSHIRREPFVYWQTVCKPEVDLFHCRFNCVELLLVLTDATTHREFSLVNAPLMTSTDAQYTNTHQIALLC